jgi:hypothetical protein
LVLEIASPDAAQYCDTRPHEFRREPQKGKAEIIREQNYIRRPLDLLRKWHNHIEAWILEQAGIEFIVEKPGLQVVRNT